MRVAYPSVGTFVSLHEVGLMPLSASLAITLKMPGTGILSVTAFHEKAGRSQGNSGFIVSFCSLS